MGQAFIGTNWMKTSACSDYSWVWGIAHGAIGSPHELQSVFSSKTVVRPQCREVIVMTAKKGIQEISQKCGTGQSGQHESEKFGWVH